MRSLFSLALGLAIVTPAVAADPTDGKLPPDRPPSTMTSTEIKAYNAGLDPKHIYFIRCRKTDVVGSLVKKLRVSLALLPGPRRSSPPQLRSRASNGRW